MSSDEERLARVALAGMCEPGAVAVHEAVERRGAVEVWHRLRAGDPVDRVSPVVAEGARARATRRDPARDLAELARGGGRAVIPGDDEWPGERLAWQGELDAPPPLVLFARGRPPVERVLRRSVAVVGARAASAYGLHVAGELGLGLADRGWTVVSGAAYGVDGSAHRGALASAETATVAVLAGGVDVPYPRGHTTLIDRIAEEGLVLAEVPPGCAPTRSRFLVRNRLIAALTVGTVVVEAALRSGSLSTARQARSLGRQVMAVPGPVTSDLSAGCHQLLRCGAVCVTDVADVLDAVGALGADAAPHREGPSRPRDSLSELVRLVLDAVPVARWAGPAGIAHAAGVSVQVVQEVLPPLEVAGLVESGLSGWRLTPLGAGR